jgi:hypothetical protein
VQAVDIIDVFGRRFARGAGVYSPPLVPTSDGLSTLFNNVLEHSPPLPRSDGLSAVMLIVGLSAVEVVVPSLGFRTGSSKGNVRAPGINVISAG